MDNGKHILVEKPMAITSGISKKNSRQRVFAAEVKEFVYSILKGRTLAVPRRKEGQQWKWPLPPTSDETPDKL